MKLDMFVDLDFEPSAIINNVNSAATAYKYKRGIKTHINAQNTYIQLSQDLKQSNKTI